MKKLTYLSLIIALFSCKKSNDNVYIRIQNLSSTPFLNVTKNNVEYGAVNTGSKTPYKVYNQPVIAYPGAAVNTSNSSLYAGYSYCGTPPLPYLENGRYTLVIKDGVANSGLNFTAQYIKD